MASRPFQPLVLVKQRSPENLQPPASRDFDETPLQRREEIERVLAEWKAPILSDDVIDTAGQIFLSQRGHELVPFFFWLEGWLRRWRG